jgi:hypothetical protein
MPVACVLKGYPFYTRQAEAVPGEGFQQVIK